SLVTRDYDSLSQVTQETLNGGTTSSVYDGAGNLLSCTYPGGRVITTAYDELERPKTIRDSNGLVAAYEYAGMDRVRRRDYGNGTRSVYTYDGATGVPNPANDFGVRKIIGTTHSRIANPAVFDARSYTWDRTGNKTARNKTIPGSELAVYAYDSVDRLTRST